MRDTEDLLLLATAKVKSIKCKTSITELMAVWSLYDVCTSVTKSKASRSTLHTSRFSKGKKS